MMQSHSRELVVEGVVLIALCVGAWFIFVERPAGRLATLEASIAATEDEAGALPLDAAITVFASEARQAQSLLSGVEEQSRQGLDPTALYESIMACAREEQVDVLRLAPGTNETATQPPASAPKRGGTGGSAATALIDVTTTRLTLAVEADFDAVSSFIERLRSLPVFIRPSGVTMMAVASRPGRCNATLELDVLSFAMPAVPAGLDKESADATQ